MDAQAVAGNAVSGPVTGGRHAGVLAFGPVSAAVNAAAGDAFVVTWGSVSNTVSAGDSAFVAAGTGGSVTVSAPNDAAVVSFGPMSAYVNAGRDAYAWSAGPLTGNLQAGRDGAVISLAASDMGLTTGRDAWVPGTPYLIDAWYASCCGRWMARLARVVVPGMPHPITQRGNRLQQTFFCEEDYASYQDLMGQWCREYGVQIWAYCLMPNHVHLIAVPQTADGLRRAIGEAHRRYTRQVNFREGWRGHLWQGRFASFVMDGPYLLAAARYVELNPVRAGLVTAPSEYPWSSARAHLAGRDDGLVQVSPLLQLARLAAAAQQCGARRGVEIPAEP